MKLLKKLEKKDLIVMETKDVDKLFSWRDEGRKDLVRNFKSILTDVVIEVRGAVFIHVLKLEEDPTFTHRFTVYNGLNNREDIVLIVDWDRVTQYGETNIDKIPYLKGTPEHKDFVQSTISVYTSLMAYMEHNREVITERQVSKQVKKKGKKGKGSKYTYLKRRVYHLPEEIKDYEDKSEGKDKRPYTKPTEPFPVRGHWRHYKNGNKVWIPSYPKYLPKDEENAEVKPKRYKFN